MSIPENNPGALANGQKQNNPVNGSGKSNNGCEYSTHSEGGATGGW